MAKIYQLRLYSDQSQGAKGAVCEVREGEPAIIGRADAIALTVPDIDVSRHHAKVWVEKDQLLIEDLGSRNGTLVNGKRVERAALDLGAWITVGASVIQVETPGTDPAKGEWSTDEETRLRKKYQPTQRLQGTVEEMPVSDLVQTVARAGRDRLVVIASQRFVGRFRFKAGQLIDAAIDGLSPAQADKAIFRMFLWETGTFSLHPLDSTDEAPGLDRPVELILLEAVRHFDETRRLRAMLPRFDRRLVATERAAAFVRTPRQRAMLDLITRHPTIAEALDHDPAPDLGLLETLHEFISAGLIKPAA